MNPQTPAQGILKRNDWGDSMWYSIACDCSTDEHCHEVDIKADECGVNVNIHTTSYTDYADSFWDRLKQKFSVTWDIWIKGVVKTQSELAMKEQVAVNYSHTLLKAVEDVKKFKQSK